jgi:hypothetical protein
MASDRLGMEASVQRIFIFAQTVRAERKVGHGCFRTVVGDAGDDTVAGSAVRAVYERVMVAPVGRVKKLPQAVGAYG